MTDKTYQKNIGPKSLATKNCFTLIELLTVIAIIGILMTILMPSLKKARAKSLAAVCLSNQKQINIGFLLYANNNQQHFVPMMYTGKTNAWQRTLHVEGYLVVPDGDPSNGKWVASEDKNFVFWCPTETVHSPYGDIGLNSNITKQQDRYTRYNEIIKPATTVLVGDAHGGGTNGRGGYWINAKDWIADDLLMTNGGSPYPDKDRHLHKSASIFVDGHGEFINASRVISQKRTLYTGPKDLTNPEYNP